MFHRKDAVLVAVASLLASSGFAMAETPDLKTPNLSLDPTVVTAQSAPDAPAVSPPSTLLEQELDKAGIAKEMYGITVQGFVEVGYSYGHRGNDVGGPPGLRPGPFNHEVGNHLMMNQFDLQIANTVDPTKMGDVGGMIEVMYGTDAGFIHSGGMPFNGNDPTDDGSPADSVPDKYQANYQFDVTQAYIDVSAGNNLTFRAGKFVTLFGTETINPTTNAFYSHSWLFNAIPFTQTGVLANYKLNAEWDFIGGVTRGWDMTLEDNNGSPDALGKIAYTPASVSGLEIDLVWGTGPENTGDTSHYRTTINPLVSWQVNEKWKVGAEAAVRIRWRPPGRRRCRPLARLWRCLGWRSVSPVHHQRIRDGQRPLRKVSRLHHFQLHQRVLRHAGPHGHSVAGSDWQKPVVPPGNSL